MATPGTEIPSRSPFMVQSRAAPPETEGLSWSARFLLLHIIVEYGRPMDVFPVIGAIRPALILSCLLAVIWLLSAKKSRALSPVLLFYLALLAWMAILAPFAVNNYLPFVLFKGLLLLFIVHMCMPTFFSNQRRLRAFQHVWLGIAIYLAIRGIQTKGRAGSYFLGDENDFCLMMNIMIPFSFFALFGKQKSWMRLLLIGSLGLYVAAIVYSFSRGGFVGFIGVIIICWLFSPRKIVSAGVIGAIAVVLMFVGSETYWNEMGTIRDPDDPTRAGRMNHWKAGARIFIHNPLGVGPGNYPFRVGEYDYEFRKVDRTISGRAAHSLYFTILPELGVPGVLAFLGIVGACGVLSRRTLRLCKQHPDLVPTVVRQLTMGSLAALGGYLVTGIFISVAYYPHLYYLAGIVVACYKVAIDSMPVRER